MALREEILELSKKINTEGFKEALVTEEGAKASLVVPFLHALGYDTSNPLEVRPEFNASVGTKKDFRADYAIGSTEKGEFTPVIIVECKALGTPLSDTEWSQLLQYVTNIKTARFGILTDGNLYRFYADLDNDGTMSDKPYMEFLLEKPNQRLFSELEKLSKGKWDADGAIKSAEELKVQHEFKSYFADQFEEETLDEDYLRFFLKKCYAGKATDKVISRFKKVLLKVFAEYVDDEVNNRLQEALKKVEPKVVAPSEPIQAEQKDTGAEKDGIVTTKEELDGLSVVQLVLYGMCDESRITLNDTKGYCGIYYTLPKQTKGRSLVRMYFNNKEKMKIRIFDGDGGWTEDLPIEKVNDILLYKMKIRALLQKYLDDDSGNSKDSKEAEQ